MSIPKEMTSISIRDAFILRPFSTLAFQLAQSWMRGQTSELTR